ncbi:MAG: NnrS family protein [Verrucomicrobia subdivision 3 bacterium]|nr:NnrS family protein [Limisphaerales bacterium]
MTASFVKSVSREPFRLFFIQAVVAGLIGVILWPLHFWGVADIYPGTSHIRLMVFGFFGGFIFGFLGTALPRMLSSRPFTQWQVLTLLALHAAMVGAYTLSKILAGDFLLLSLLVTFISCVIPRARVRKDVPPPGFVLVGFAFVAVFAGTILSLIQSWKELPLFWVYLQRLLSSQAFLLLPIVGIGPFILPRFFGLPSGHNFPESLTAPPGWGRKALLALATGITILTSLVLEAAGWYRLGHALRFAAVLIYWAVEMPFRSAPGLSTAFGAALRIAFLLLLAGFLAVVFFPAYRVSLLHVTLIGGFAVITFVVGTRVVFGHSGNLDKLQQPNRWLLIPILLMLLGMATRISGDIWPDVLPSHYSYGAIIWILGAIAWAIKVLPKTAIVPDED